MLAAFLLALIAQAQTIRVERPPATPFVVHATVPAPGPLRSAAGFPSSSRRLFTLADGTIGTELSVLVPGGTTSVGVQPGADTGPSLVDSTLSWLARPGRVSLWIDGQRFSLSDPAHFNGWHRNGRVHKTARMHRELGPYGSAEWWWDVRADGGIDLALLWHRASPGPDVRFERARLVVPGGAWQPVVVPPACAPPFLVSPRADGARHIIPQRMGMAFWIHLAGPQEVVGVADWSRGGYLPSGFPVAQDTPREPYAAKLAVARARLAGLQPEPAWGTPPVSPLWPASGVTHGGEGGGDGRLPLDGVQWAASRGDPDALSYYRIGLLRRLARNRIHLDADGGPLRLTGLPRTWAFDVDFVPASSAPGGRADAPWEFDRWPVDWAGGADPRRFNGDDTASMQRFYRFAWVLTWLADDPLADLLTREGGTRGALTFGPFAHPPTPGIGTDVGGREAQAMLAVVAARCLGETQYEPLVSSYVAHLRAAQMESGCLVARAGQYPTELPPFNAWPGIRLQGAAEFSYHMLALRSIGGASDVLRWCARGLQGIQLDEDDPSAYYYSVTGMGAVRYIDEDEWPVALHDAMGFIGTSGYYVFTDTGVSVALAWAVQAPERFELLRRVLGTTSPATGAAILRSWGVEAPSSHSNTPVEQWWPLLSILEAQ